VQVVFWPGRSPVSC